MKRLICLLLLIGCCEPQECRAESVMLSTSYSDAAGRNLQDQGTGVCIASTNRGSLILTCKHNIQSNPAGVWIYHRHDWHRCFNPVLHPNEDLATVETTIRFHPTSLADESPAGQQVTIEGAGPAANETDEPLAFSGRLIDESTIAGDDGRHVALGDSGGPVLCDAGGRVAVLGIVNAVEGDAGPSRRDQFPGAKTRYISCRKIVVWMQTQYGGCPSGICPIRIRPRVVQPMFGIGIPSGPPVIVNEAVPVMPSQPIRPVPDPAFISGPAGPRGATGPQGERGADGRSVTKQEVEVTINTWLEANIDRIKGPPGEAADASALESRVSALESRKLRVIVSNENKIIDDESYDVNAGEPVVLDIRKLTTAK